MRVWVVSVGEPLPFDEGHPRLLRAGILARMMAARGHDVTWWSSTVIHMQKTLRFNETTVVPQGPNLNIVCLHGGLYTKNISIARIANQVRLAFAFFGKAKTMPKPDVIFCAMPTIEFCTAAVLLKKQTGAKVVMDVRDYWPDIWEEAAPEKWRWLAKLFIAPWQFMLRWSLMRADRVMGFTDLAVDWAFSKVSRKRTPADMGVPMAYELQKFDEDVMQKARAGWDARGIDTKKTTICMIGTLTSRFAHLMHDAIEAVRLIPAEQRKNFRLVFAGTGEAAEGLKDAARDLPEIIFPGWIGAPDIQTLMERSCAGLLPYPNTADFLVAMPNKSIEYLAGGLPIMSCLRGQIGKLINTEDCGFSYTEGDVTSLATQFQRALNEPDTFEDKGHKARALYDRRFTPDAVYGGLIDALENLKK